MKIPYLQLSQHLSKHLASIYLINSDELLLSQEAAEMIRTTANLAGFTERVLITPESGSDWNEIFYSSTHNLSLFNTKKIIEINLQHTKLNQANGKILEKYVKKPLADIILIIQTPKCEAAAEKSAWFQAIEKNSVVITIWPLSKEQLPAWMIQRAKKLNLHITPAAAERLASFVEGNVLAAAQEVEKLSLLQMNNSITEEIINDIITDHARFDVFQLVDSVLLGNKKRSIHILKNLAANEEPPLVLWALVREIRMLSDLLQQQKKTPLDHLFTQYRIWEKRQPGVRAFLQRHTVATCWNLLLQAANIDNIIKGAGNGNIWHELELFVMAVMDPSLNVFVCELSSNYA